MKIIKLLTIFLITLLTINPSFAQDTTVVQTLDFNDITKRRGWYVFPEDTSYQKVLMYYTLKCDAATTQDGYACGEWDYSTFTNLYQHNNIGTPYFSVNGQHPDTINYVSNATYTYYQHQQYHIVYDNTTSENNYNVGSGSTPVNHTLNATTANNKAQYLWTATELTTAGLSAGNIDKLKLDISSLGDNLNYLTIKMKHSALSTLSESSYENTNLTTVYSINTSFATGINTINLTTPFNWDGTSNVIIDISFSNPNGGTGHVLNGETTASNMGVHSTQDDGYLDFEWGNYVEVPGAAFNNVTNQVSISFWQYGDTQTQPRNNYTFEGRDASGNRVINAHLPWSNSNVYWDAGNSGTSSYDRINKTANFSDFAGQWNHWVFTKNSGSGSMKIYLNGVLWHTGSAKFKNMAGITNFKIAGQAGTNNYGKYDGAINNFEVWNVELSQATIQSWMNKDVDPSHPNYANLQAYYKFDDMTGAIATDVSGNGHNGVLNGMPSWNYLKGGELHRNLTATNERPNIIFTQGVYTSHIDSTLVLDSVINPQISIIETTPTVDINVSGIDYVYVGTTYGWESGWVYTYNDNGVKVDSTFINHDNQFFNTYSTNTFQVQNYVTPYGIGLDLGANGFRWVYDVTDYARLLHDTIELSAGNQQELIDIKFIMIKGTPPRDVLSSEQLAVGNWQHADIANDAVLQAKNYTLDPAASQFRIKTRTTGHWFGGFENCAEFCPKLHHLKIDGVKQFEWMNWKECADNPVIDQGGTWIYDRAGWCPGTFSPTFDHDLTPFVTPGSTVSIDYGMEYDAVGMEGNYWVSTQLISYGAPNFTLDARVEEIISPNNWEFHNRVNPICDDPKIVIKNTGATTLTSLTITYNVEGGTPENYTWTGSLDFLETEEVVLPIPSQSFWVTASSNNIFEVSVSAPNGGTDEYALNNDARAAFDKPDLYTTDLFLAYKTNLAAYENSYTLKDDQGNVLYSKAAFSMPNSTVNLDTFNLASGCYLFEWNDSGQDGLEFFANNDGNGFLKLVNEATGVLVKDFNPNHGSFVKYYFVVDKTTGINEENNSQQINVFPNPSKGEFNVSITGFENGNIDLEVFNAMGRLIHSESTKSTNKLVKTTLDLNNESTGVYFIRIKANDGFVVKRIVKY